MIESQNKNPQDKSDDCCNNETCTTLHHFISISLDEQWSITYSYSTMPGIYSSKQTKSPEDEVCS